MNFDRYDILDNESSFKIKLFNIEDCLYNGENGKYHEFELPHDFDVSVNFHIKNVLEKLEDVIIENNYDTFSIIVNTEVEHLYNLNTK